MKLDVSFAICMFLSVAVVGTLAAVYWQEEKAIQRRLYDFDEETATYR